MNQDPPKPGSPDSETVPMTPDPAVSGTSNVINPGDTLAEYRILRTLGKGGMGTVYLAYDPVIHRQVAVKVLSCVLSKELQEQIVRFLNEAMLTGRLMHSGIVPVYQVGFAHGRGYYYSMRYLRGQSLDRLFPNGIGEEQYFRGGDPLRRLLDIMLRVCEAVGYAHRHGVVHRDLKPPNVMVSESDEVFIVDWGVAKDLKTVDPLADAAAPDPLPEPIADACRRDHRFHAAGLQRRQASMRPVLDRLKSAFQGPALPEVLEPVTLDNFIVGTPVYMSPEQLRRQRITPASDVFSIGVMLYEMLTGRMPSESRDLMPLIAEVTSGRLKPIEQQPQAYRLPQALCAIVNRCMAMDPADRYAEAGELGAALRLYVEGRTPYSVLVKSSYHGATTEPEQASAQWDAVAGAAGRTDAGLSLAAGVILRSKQRATGDFRCELRFQPASPTWNMGVSIDDGIGTAASGAHEICLSQTDRSSIELLWRKRRVLRGFNVRFQLGRTYRLTLELDDEYLRASVDGELLIVHHRMFSQTGGAIVLGVEKGTVIVRDFEWESRGAPLHLSFHYLPDRYFLSGEFEQAARLYSLLAESHPHREEGLLALYKAGLCAVELGRNDEATRAFARLDNTMLAHYSILGAAHLRLHARDTEGAWEVLTHGYRQYGHPEARAEIWFSLLDVLDRIDATQWKVRTGKYAQLLRELNPAPQEAGQLTSEFLDQVRRRDGVQGMRREAQRLVEGNRKNAHVIAETALTLWRSAIDEPVAAIVQSALGAMDWRGISPGLAGRLYMIKAELAMGRLDFAEAEGLLRKAMRLPDQHIADRLWARYWLVLCAHLMGNAWRVLDEEEVLLRSSDDSPVDWMAYGCVIIACAMLQSGRTDEAAQQLDRARQYACWWGQVAKAVLDRVAPLGRALSHPSPNLESEGLFLAAELHRLLGHEPDAREIYKAGVNHPSRRLLTVRLSQMRLEQFG